MLYMVTFTINIPQMLAYIPYMDPMGISLGNIGKWLHISRWTSEPAKETADLELRLGQVIMCSELRKEQQLMNNCYH